MAVTVINRPIGHKLGSDYIQAIIYDVSGDAVVYVDGGHTLSDGDYVYIESNFERYNGFKYVDSIAYDSFKIKNSEGGDIIEFIQEADIQFRISELEHGFQCVHLPIVYELHSDLWPTNEAEEAYTPVVIDSFEDNNGYVQLNLSVTIDPVELNYIELVGSGSLVGAYQIIDVLQPWSIVINLAYDATFDFSGYQVVNYYNNYFIKVYVYGGLEVHPWSGVKPIHELAIVKLIPDSNNNARLSVSDILKGVITTRNNLTLDTLPNNIDFFTNFYITTSENYDRNISGEIISVEGGFLADKVNFIGGAINAMLPFKSLNSGHLSDYIATNGTPSRWLTLFDRPIAVVGYFFDLSFINQYNNIDLQVSINKYLNGLLVDEETLSISNPGMGVLRIPFTPISGTDEYCVEVHTDVTTGSMEIPALSTWATRSIDVDLVDWTTGATPTVNLPGTGGLFGTKSSEVLYTSFSFISGYTYYITVSYTRTVNSGSSNPRSISIIAYDDSFISLQSAGVAMVSGSGSAILTFIATGLETKLGLSCASGSNVTIDINSVTGTQTTPVQQITEQICIDIIDECGSTFTNDNLRLTEGGEFRELE